MIALLKKETQLLIRMLKMILFPMLVRMILMKTTLHFWAVKLPQTYGMQMLAAVRDSVPEKISGNKNNAGKGLKFLMSVCFSLTKYPLNH